MKNSVKLRNFFDLLFCFGQSCLAHNIIQKFLDTSGLFHFSSHFVVAKEVILDFWCAVGQFETSLTSTRAILGDFVVVFDETLTLSNDVEQHRVFSILQIQRLEGCLIRGTFLGTFACAAFAFWARVALAA